MWPRVVEVMLGCWLIISPLVFRMGRGEYDLILHHIGAGVAVVVLALCAIPIRFLHLEVLLVALWLIGYGYFAGGYPADPGYQNLMLTGILLSFMAIIPSDHLQPTRSWREFYRNKDL